MKVLVVEDDAPLRDAISITLETAGYDVKAASGGDEALTFLERQRFGMVVSDLRMDPMDGLQLLEQIRSRYPGLPVLLMTAFGDVDKAVAAMRGGACDFMLKPFEPKALIEQIQRYAKPPVSGSGLVAEDSRTRDVLLLAARVARTDATVFLSGESGVGKEVFARYIHEQSSRASGPFVAINCAAIPDTLLEATLFGHEKGAFTGAQGAQAGKFEQANGGTLLLDEISEMPLPLQAKLLRVLQERVVDRVGGKKPVALDIRVIATSNRNMQEEVEKGGFREDLFYRLNVFPIEIPPLRERPLDIVPLARHFADALGQKTGAMVRFNKEAEAKLSAHHWPGNVRELENVIQRALILAMEGTVTMDDVVLSSQPIPRSAGLAVPPVAVNTPPAEVLPATLSTVSGASATNMRDLERQHILDTLAAVGGSRKEAIARLGISERTLRYKLKQYREEGFLKD